MDQIDNLFKMDTFKNKVKKKNVKALYDKLVIFHKLWDAYAMGDSAKDTLGVIRKDWDFQG